MKYLLTAFCALFLFSCSDDDNETTIAHTTLIVYIAGENSLSSFAPTDLKYITEASKGIGSNDHLVVFFDNASKTSMPYIAELKNGEIVKDTGKEFSEDFYSSDPDKMLEILTYIMQHYPAENYGIDLWGHASGWLVSNDSVASTRSSRAYGIDNGNNSASDYGKWMNIPTMARVFSQLPHKFKFVIGDCCFFQCVESAYELKDCTDYVFGCPSEVPGYGGAYQVIIPKFFSDSPTFYEDVISTCSEIIGSGDEGVPMSVIKTSEMERFAAATAKIMPDLLQYDDFQGKRLVYYGVFMDDKYKYKKGYYDPKNLVLEYAADNPYRQEWEDALKAMIPCCIKCKRWMANHETYGLDFSSFDVNDDTFSGVSMFVPQPMYESLTPNPNETIKQFKWANAVGIK